LHHRNACWTPVVSCLVPQDTLTSTTSTITPHFPFPHIVLKPHKETNLVQGCFFALLSLS
jgi:hypothetical protein